VINDTIEVLNTLFEWILITTPFTLPRLLDFLYYMSPRQFLIYICIYKEFKPE